MPACNVYAPAGFEQVLICPAKPEERRELCRPINPPDHGRQDLQQLFERRARDWALSRLGYD
jgi:hypothetical protein